MIESQRRWKQLRLLAAMLACAALPAAAQDPTGKKHALVIGINGPASPFVGIPTLKYAGKDATEMTRLLEAGGWDVELIPPREGTRARIVQGLSRLAFEAQEQDTVLIYFAGHGARDPGPSKQTYWVTYLVNPRDLAVEGIRLNHLLEYVSEIPAARKLIILDHCYSGDVERTGTGDGEAGGRDGEGEARIVRRVFPLEEFTREVEGRIPRGLVILGAALEEAYELPNIEHGVFTYVLLDLLRDGRTDADGNGRIAITELAPRITEKLNQLTTTQSIHQVPIEVIRGTGISGWEPFDASVGAGEGLRRFLTELDLRARLDSLVKGKCFAAIRNWEQARTAGIAASERDQRIVDELNGLRDAGDSVDAETKRESLERLVEALP